MHPIVVTLKMFPDRLSGLHTTHLLLCQVVLLPSFGLSAPATEDNTTQPLKLTDTDPLLVHLTAEAAAYWRGLELLAGSPLLSAHNTCDVVLNPETDHPGAQGFSLLQVGLDDACWHFAGVDRSLSDTTDHACCSGLMSLSFSC